MLSSRRINYKIAFKRWDSNHKRKKADELNTKLISIINQVTISKITTGGGLEENIKVKTIYIKSKAKLVYMKTETKISFLEKAFQNIRASKMSLQAL